MKIKGLIDYNVKLSSLDWFRFLHHRTTIAVATREPAAPRSVSVECQLSTDNPCSSDNTRPVCTQRKL